MVFCRSFLIRKQTKFPPKQFIPIQDNPLARWSTRLPAQWNTQEGENHLKGISVGLEGCDAAFNATNAIRTCWHFQCGRPPTFLSLQSWKDIEHLQHRSGADPSSQSDAAERGEEEEFESQTVPEKNGMALFGEEKFLSNDDLGGITVLENYRSSSRSLLRHRVPSTSRVVVGHENKGVRDALVAKSDSQSGGVAQQRNTSVFYIPQYGTISSLNVVTALGIGLFYAFLDAHYPQARELVVSHVSAEQRKVFARLVSYHESFGKDLPSSGTSRVDPRPIHPFFYNKDEASIVSLLQEHRQALLKLSQQGSGAKEEVRRFGLSVLYENDFDQRNFGGLLRNANTFLVDQVCYLGRRKYNVVGSVGCYHYTPPQYLGGGFEAEEKNLSDSDTVGTAVKQALSAYKEADPHRDRIIKLACWSLQLRERLANACGGPSRLWLLDCGHHDLYAEDFAILQKELKDRKGQGSSVENITAGPLKSSLESLRWYLTHCTDDKFVLSLCEREETIREAAGSGVVLVVPQEGKLPHISVLMQCERILTVTPPSLKEGTVSTATGLSSQVASGIALQRLSAILHPTLAQLA